MIYIGTDYILKEELAYGLYELNFKSPDQKSRRRYQIIVVNRDDKLAEHRIDMGLAKKFKHDQLRIPSMFVHTVGELQDMANQLRKQPSLDKLERVGVNKIK